MIRAGVLHSIPRDTGVLRCLERVETERSNLVNLRDAWDVDRVAVRPLKGLATNAEGPPVIRIRLGCWKIAETPTDSTRAQVDRQRCRESAPLDSRTQSGSPAKTAELEMDNSEEYTKSGTSL